MKTLRDKAFDRNFEITEAFKEEVRRDYEIQTGHFTGYALKPKRRTPESEKESYILEKMLEEMDRTFIPGILDVLLGDLKGKRVLDIGCGGTYRDSSNGSFRNASLCWLLERLGVDIVGIDPIKPPAINFEFYPIRAEDIDKQFREGEFDVVYTKLFWEAPSRIYAIQEEFGFNIHNNPKWQEFIRERDYDIMKKIYRILKKGGFYVGEFDSFPSNRYDPNFSELELDRSHLVLRKREGK